MEAGVLYVGNEMENRETEPDGESVAEEIDSASGSDSIIKICLKELDLAFK